MDDELIATIHTVPSEWTYVMRRMAIACDYLCRAVQGDLPAEDDESSEEEYDDDIDSYYEDDSESY